MRVGAHPGRPARKVHGQLDVLADQPPHHPVQGSDDQVHVENHRLGHLLAREREELTGQHGGALGRGLDLPGAAFTRCSGKQVEQGFAVPHENGQDIVEVVRDSARQPSDCLHFLRLEEAPLQQPLFGDILEKRGIRQEAEALVEKRVRADRHPGRRAVAAAELGFKAPHVPVGTERAHQVRMPPRVREEMLGNARQGLRQLLRQPVSENSRQGSICRREIAGRVALVDALDGVFEDLRIPLLGIHENRGFAPLLGDVVAGPQGESSGVELDRVLGKIHPAFEGVAREYLELAPGRHAFSPFCGARDSFRSPSEIGVHEVFASLPHQLVLWPSREGRRAAVRVDDRVRLEQEDGCPGGFREEMKHRLEGKNRFRCRDPFPSHGSHSRHTL